MNLNNYGVEEQTFLASLVARRTMTSNETVEVLEKIKKISGYNESVDTEDVEEIIDKLNLHLEEWDMKIEKSRDQREGHANYTLINRAPGPIATMATTLSPSEIEYFRVILDEMFCDEKNKPKNKFSISRVRVADCRKHLTENSTTKLVSGEINQLVEKLISDGWLEENDRRALFPSTRLLVELKSYLIDRYGQDGLEGYTTLNNCAGCGDIFTIGRQCCTEDCPTRIHFSCERAYYQQIGSSMCPLCSKDLAKGWEIN
jgi:hypothetical protein